MIKVEWLAILIPSSVGSVKGHKFASVESSHFPANGNQRPAAMTNKKEIIMTKYMSTT
jgi:hypothetical protein